MPTLPHLIHQNYHNNNENAAIILQHARQEDIPLTYKDLVHNSFRFVNAYQRECIQPGEVVILILDHGTDLVFSFWGAILCGVIPSIMPFLTEKLSPERYRADLTALLSVTKPAAIVTTPEFELEVRAALQPGGSVRSVLLTNQLGEGNPTNLKELPGLSRDPGEIALLQHSSGTTGLQKGVALSHCAVLNQLTAYCQAIDLRADDVFISWLPLYHDMGLIAGFLMPVLNANTLVLMSPFDWVRAPYKLFQAINKYRGTLAWLPNFAYNFCAHKVRERDMVGVDLSSLRKLTNCSEPVKWESHQIFYEKFKDYGLREEVFNCSYAMAENVFGVTQTPPGTLPKADEIDHEAYISQQMLRDPVDGKAALRMMSSGRVIRNTHIRILDHEGLDLPDRVIGEIALQSDCMLTGYYNRPDVTRAALSDGWYLTGDYGYRMDGELFVTGRKKDIIIVGGKNIYPQDLMDLSYEVPGVHHGRAVAFGIEDEKAGTEEVVIVAEVDTDDPQERQKIADALRKHVSQNSAIALRQVHLVGPKWILKTSSGKTSILANREKFLAEFMS